VLYSVNGKVKEVEGEMGEAMSRVLGERPGGAYGEFQVLVEAGRREMRRQGVREREGGTKL